MTVRNVPWLWALAVLLLIFSVDSPAQEVTASISGTVRDASGALIPGATVTAVHTEKNIVVRTVKTSDEGGYVLSLLPIGHYRLSVQYPGFKTTSLNGIELNVNDKLFLDVVLQVGSANEQIEVNGQSLQVDSSGPTASGVISGSQIRDLPNNTRNFASLVRLEPGVSSLLGTDQLYVGVIGPQGTLNVLNFSVNGNRPSSNNWTLDGVGQFGPRCEFDSSHLSER